MSSFMDNVKQCEAIIGYEFADKGRALEALYTFPGYGQGPGSAVKKNDALAILGEVVLLQTLCQEWYKKNLSSGEWSTVRQDVANNEYLAKVGNKNGLDKCIILSPGTTSVSHKTMATCIKALFGAVKLDSGDADVVAVIGKLKLGHELLEAVMLNIS